VKVAEEGEEKVGKTGDGKRGEETGGDGKKVERAPVCMLIFFFFLNFFRIAYYPMTFICELDPYAHEPR